MDREEIVKSMFSYAQLPMRTQERMELALNRNKSNRGTDVHCVASRANKPTNER